MEDRENVQPGTSFSNKRKNSVASKLMTPKLQEGAVYLDIGLLFKLQLSWL